MEIDQNSIETQLPYYLTQDQKKGLTNALKDFINDKPINYYIGKYPDDLLQGDGWSGLEVIRFSNGDRDHTWGIILTNTCDISPDNFRYLPSNIVFAPLVRLKDYINLLRKAAPSDRNIDEVINGKLNAIKGQLITNIFYLPQGGQLEDEHIAILDDLHTIPKQHFIRSQYRDKRFTLSLIGFYLFIFKLSVHFCRLHEGVDRDDTE